MPNNFYGVGQNIHLPPMVTRFHRGQMVYNLNRKPVTFTPKPFTHANVKPPLNVRGSTRKLNVFGTTRPRNMRRRTRRNRRN